MLAFPEKHGTGTMVTDDAEEYNGCFLNREVREGLSFASP